MNKKLLLLVLVFIGTALTQIAFAQSITEEEGFQGPGGCTSKEECRMYCDEDSHKKECLTFAVQNGLMTQEETDRAMKYLNQTGPGGCRGDECRQYCSDSSHKEECIIFAVDNGLIQPEDAERFRKFKDIEEKGGPGGCKGEECRSYCEDESHRDECFAFAREHGLIGKEEVKHYESGLKIREKIKTAGGPGGCTSENECREYCSNIDHVEECVAFGAEHTGKSPEEVRSMLEEFKRHRERFQNDQRFGDFEERGFGEFDDFERDRFQEPNFERRGEFHRPEGCDSKESCRKIREMMVTGGSENSGFQERPDAGMMNEEERRRMMEEYQRQNPMPASTMPPQEYQMPQGYPDGSAYPRLDNYQQYQENYQPAQYQYQYQYQEPTTTSEPTFTPSPSDIQPTSYNHSRSFLANIISAFLAPFRK